MLSESFQRLAKELREGKIHDDAHDSAGDDGGDDDDGGRGGEISLAIITSIGEIKKDSTIAMGGGGGKDLFLSLWVVFATVDLWDM